MKKFKRTISVIISMTMLLILTNSMEVKAALQANPNTQYTKTTTPGNWMSYFRQMEASGGAMGLSETLNSDLTASSDSNNIDVHMMRSTEYGAIAILSASGYGNSSNNKAITSTTGNNTGIILNTTGKWEWVAGGYESNISGLDPRYYDTYTTSNESARIGDALGNAATTNPGCNGWHSAEYAIWIDGGWHGSIMRGNGGIFAFSRETTAVVNYSRGVVVCGAEF